MNETTRETWRVDESDFPRSGSPKERAAFLLRYAVLAPSSHNSQPWEFRIRNGGVDVYADLSRWLQVADADQRELYVSVGCAVENLVVAAEHFGLAARVEHSPAASHGALAARVRLEEAGEGSSPTRPPELFDAIFRRHTNHREYDARPISDALRVELEALAVEPGIEIRFTDDPEVRQKVDDLVVRADALQFADPAWREELASWLGRGVFGHGWLLSKMAKLAVSHLDLSGSVSRKDRRLLGSASLLGLVAVDGVNRESRIRTGQVFERLFLGATEAGLALQPMNQILQVEEVRDAFEALLPRGWGTPQITFRLGRAEPEDHTPRRPLDEVVRPPPEEEVGASSPAVPD